MCAGYAGDVLDPVWRQCDDSDVHEKAGNRVGPLTLDLRGKSGA